MRSKYVHEGLHAEHDRRIPLRVPLTNRRCTAFKMDARNDPVTGVPVRCVATWEIPSFLRLFDVFRSIFANSVRFIYDQRDSDADRGRYKGLIPPDRPGEPPFRVADFTMSGGSVATLRRPTKGNIIMANNVWLVPHFEEAQLFWETIIVAGRELREGNHERSRELLQRI
jgi:hypothetical protein